MIGFFGIAEVFIQLHQIGIQPIRQNLDKILPSWTLVKKYLPLSLQTSGIGVIIGALPGTGGDIAAMLAYDHAKRVTPEPATPFGEGAYEGLIAAESSNNAAVGGAYIPMLTLGMPGDAVTAVIIGALFIHGIQPGPLMLTETPHLFWYTVGNLTLANLCILVFGLTGIRLFSKIVQCPKGILLPVIIVLSVVGTYAIQNSVTDVYWMFGCGILGYFLKTYGYQVAPIILGIILGPLMDVSYRRAVISVQDDLGDFFWALVSNPISLVLVVGIAAVLIHNVRKRR
jgi:putative tricarboxylic transport membrane protein